MKQCFTTTDENAFSVESMIYGGIFRTARFFALEAEWKSAKKRTPATLE
jgi:hypothetical protein